jgi:hypothetical protein
MVMDIWEEAPKKEPGIYDHDGVTKVISFPRTERGLYAVNRLHCNPHYEVTQPEYRKKKTLLQQRTDAQLVEVVDGSRMTLDENE